MKITINGKVIEGVGEGLTILQIAQRNGIRIPTLCHMESLIPIGSCRMCVVEVQGIDNPVTACNTLAVDGMVIETDTPKIFDLRREVLQFLLVKHPLDCPVCDKGGECDLQDYVYEYGIKQAVYQVDGTAKEYHVYATPAIQYHPNRCILCLRCIRTCREVVGREVLDLKETGFDTRIEPVRPERCISCGECLAACPVGALTERVSYLKGRKWQARKVSTVCGYCGVGCSLEVHVVGNRVIKVTSKEGLGTNKGVLCVKGRFGFEFVNSPQRLRTPLVRENGVLKEAGWDKALPYLAEKLREIKERYGPNSIAGIASGRVTCEENYLFQKFIRAAIGTNNIDHCDRFSHSSSALGLAATLGSGAMTNSLADLREADVILVTGSNTTETHPIIGMLLRNRSRFHGTKIIVVDPRRIDLTEEVDLFLQPKPGVDIAWLNGLAHVILKENLYNKPFIEQHTEGFEAFKEKVAQYTPEYVEEITGIPKDQLVKAARLYGTAKNASILYCMGITQHSNGTDGVKAISNLALLCGQLGKPGSGINPLRGQNNVQGACDMGCLPDLFPGYQEVGLREVREGFENHWGVPLSEKAGLTIVEMVEAAHEGKVKAIYIMGGNPLVTVPYLSRLKKAFENLELLVVQDIFLTESAEAAHVVLPTLSFLEKDGTFVNTERRVQRVRKALIGPEGARADWEIISELSTLVGYPMYYRNTEEIFEEIRKVTPQYGGITYARLESGGIQWPCPDVTHPGTSILHSGKIMRGKGLFVPVDYTSPPEVPDSEFPFILSTGRDYYHYHAGSMTRRVRLLNERCPESLVEINPSDADRLEISEGEQVRIVSRRGDFTPRVKITDRVPRGVIFATFHFSEAPVNLLTNTVLDPESKITDLKYSTVRIEKVSR